MRDTQLLFIAPDSPGPTRGAIDSGSSALAKSASLRPIHQMSPDARRVSNSRSVDH